MPTPAQEKMRMFAKRFTPAHSVVKHLALFGISLATSFILVLAYNYFYSLSGIILNVAMMLLYIFPAFFVSTAFSYYPISFAPVKIRFLAILYGFFTFYFFFFFFVVLKYGRLVVNPLKLFYIFSHSFVTVFEVLNTRTVTSQDISVSAMIAWGMALVVIISLMVFKKSDFHSETGAIKVSRYLLLNMEKFTASFKKILIVVIIICGTVGLISGILIFVYFNTILPNRANKDFAIHGGTRLVLEVNMEGVPTNEQNAIFAETKDKILKKFDYVPSISAVNQNGKYELILQFANVAYSQNLLDLAVPKDGLLDFRLQDSERTEKFTPTGLTNSMIKKAEVAFDTVRGNPLVSVELNVVGSKLLFDITKNNVGKYIAIYFDDKFLTAPMIRDPITGGEVVISGNYSLEEARALAANINDAAGPKITIIDAKYINPTK